jgi:hypothetical protein
MFTNNIITVNHIADNQFDAWLIAFLVCSGTGMEGAYELASDQLVDLAPESCSHCGAMGHLNTHPLVKGLLCDDCHSHELEQDEKFAQEEAEELALMNSLDQYEIEEGRRHMGRINY